MSHREAPQAGSEGQTETETIEDTEEAYWEAIQDLREQVSHLENTVETRKERYEILRDVVASKTDLDAETIDQLVVRRMQGGDDE